MLKKLGLGLLVVVVIFVVFVATRPSSFAVTREAEFKAPPEVVYAQLVDFHAWAEWSPWDKLDPSMKKTYSGAASGVGAKYDWEGDKDNVGSGGMTITGVKENESVAIDLEFKVPMEAHNRTDFTLAKTADGTKLTWAMKGENGFMGKAFSLVFDMDKMVGGDFEKGLASLKTITEAAAKKAADEKAAAEKAAAEAAAAAAAAPAATDAGTP